MKIESRRANAHRLLVTSWIAEQIANLSLRGRCFMLGNRASLHPLPYSNPPALRRALDAGGRWPVAYTPLA